jgi:hypothetical protein
MRFFLCDFKGFYLAIPVDSVASLTIPFREVQRTVERDAKKGYVFFSLPHYFKRESEPIRHGIILKRHPRQALRITDARPGPQDIPPAVSKANRRILLVTAVEREEDMAPEDIRPLPRTLSLMKGLSFFTGIRFNGNDMILYVDPELLMLSIFRDEEVPEEPDGGGERAG